MQPLLDVFLRKIGAGRQHALISFRVSCEFPILGGHIFTFLPLPLATAGAVPVGMTEPFPGNLIIQYTLDTPLAEDARAEVGGINVAVVGPVDPFVPIQSIVLGGIANDQDFLALVVANGPDQPPGSPTVVIDYHIAIWTANT